MSNTAQPEPKDQLKKASFDWALRGSWEEFEKELDRMLHKTALAIPKPPAWTTVVSNKLAPATEAFNSAPDWGKGALIGAGAGALGGLLMDKKKRLRGLLQGALVGGGMGALGGYGYGQVKNLANAVAGGPPPDYDRIAQEVANPGGAAATNKPAATKPTEQSAAGQAVDKTMDLTGKALQFAATSPLTYGLGTIYGGKKLIDYGNKPLHVAGVNAGQPDPKAIAVRSSNKSVLNSLQQDPAAMDDAMARVVMDQQIKGKIPTRHIAPSTVDEIQQNTKEYLRRSAPPPIDDSAPMYQKVKQYLSRFDPASGSRRVPIQIDGHNYNIRTGDVEAMRNKQLANALGKQSLPSEGRIKAQQAAGKWGGRGLVGLGTLMSGAGLVDGGERIINHIRSGGAPSVKSFGPFTPVFDGGKGEQVLTNFLSAASKTPNPSQEVADMARRSNWSEDTLKYAIKKLMELKTP